MKLRERYVSITVLLLCAIVANVTMAMAQRTPQRDPLASLKRAITEANAPALTTMQETQLNTLITNFKDVLPDEPDEALEAALDAYDAAILAANLTAAQAQAMIIAARLAQLNNARLQAEAKFKIDALALLQSGGQLAPLKQKFGDDRVLGLVGSLVGRGFGGGPGRGGPGRP
ncbi:MAG: hypothetical protein ACREEM_05860 [Blastocatellia bacterium]